MFREAYHVHQHVQLRGIGQRFSRCAEEVQEHRSQAAQLRAGCSARQYFALSYPRLQALPVYLERRKQSQSDCGRSGVVRFVPLDRQLFWPGGGGVRIQARRLATVYVRYAQHSRTERRRHSGVPVHLPGG